MEVADTIVEARGEIPSEKGETIAYRTLRRKSPSGLPGVMFLTGFKSDMSGSKAEALHGWCLRHGVNFTRFDYTGHGASSGRFMDGTIGQWKRDALTVLDRLTEGPQILVGSSMGGWIMLLAALARPERIAALVGIAAAPDFTERLIRAEMTELEHEALARDGFFLAPSCYGEEPYPITSRLLEEGQNHQLLGNAIPMHCPVRLLHGMQDADVPWRMALKLAEKLSCADVEVTLIKDAGHRMSEPGQLALLERTVEALVERASQSSL